MVTVINQYGIDITSGLEYNLDRDIAEKAFIEALKYWPQQIEITERFFSPEGEESYIPTPDSTGGYFPSLSEVWDQTEYSIEKLKENLPGLHDKNLSMKAYIGIMNYQIFRILHSRAKKMDKVLPHNVSFSDVEPYIIRAYFGWKGQRPDEVTDNSVITIEIPGDRIISID